jgi:uncharacterized protein YegL
LVNFDLDAENTLPLVDYSTNPNQRTPCVLVLDASYSMTAKASSGKTAIEALNEGIKALEYALKNDEAALTRVQLSIVIVGGPTDDAEILMDWTDVSNFTAFPLTAGGRTPLGKGIQLGLDLIEEGKQNLRSQGISYTRPWLLIMSDGAPTDEASLWNAASNECRQAEAEKKVEVFCIGVEGADLTKFRGLSHKPPLMLDGVKFEELFQWLSESLSAASQSRPGDTLQLPSTDVWRNVGI